MSDQEKELEKVKAQTDQQRVRVAKNLAEVLEKNEIKGLFIVGYCQDGSFIDHMDIIGNSGEAAALLGRIESLKVQLSILIEQSIRQSQEQARNAKASG